MRPKKPKEVLPDGMVKDRKGRVMPINPVRDLAVRRFFSTVNAEHFEMFLREQADDKFAAFVAALNDPAYGNANFNEVMREFNITLHEVQTIYTDGKRHMALLNMSEALPAIASDVAGDAQTKLAVCPRCDGLKQIIEGEPPIVRDCPVCKAAGEVRVPGDKHARDLVFESMKLINQKGGPLVAIQQNFGADAGLDSDMEATLKLTQSITAGDPNK